MSWWQTLLAGWFGIKYVELNAANDLYIRRVRIGKWRNHLQPYVIYIGNRIWLLPNGRCAGKSYCYEFYPLNFDLPMERRRHPSVQRNDDDIGLDGDDFFWEL